MSTTPDTPEMKALAAFLAASFESKLDGAKMREAIEWALGPREVVAPPVPEPKQGQERLFLQVRKRCYGSKWAFMPADREADCRAMGWEVRWLVEEATAPQPASEPVAQITPQDYRLMLEARDALCEYANKGEVSSDVEGLIASLSFSLAIHAQPAAKQAEPEPTPEPVAGWQWVPVQERMPEIGQEVLLWVYAERHGEDDDGNPYSTDVSGVHMGEYRSTIHGEYLDNYSSPFADQEGITHWMPLPPAPKEPT